MATRHKRLLLLLLTLPLVFLGGRQAADLHIRNKSGRMLVTDRNCLRCHGSWWSTSFPEGQPHPDPWEMVASEDGKLLYVACGPMKWVAVLDLERRALLTTIGFDARPRGLALSPDGGTLAVSLRDSDQVALVDTTSFEIVRSVDVRMDPAGLAFGDDGRLLFVANAGAGNVSVVDVEQGRERHVLAAGREPYAVAASPDGALVAVASRMADRAPADQVPASELTLLDARRGQVERRIALPSSHMVEGLAFTPDGERVLVPAVHVRNLLPILQVHRGWVMSSVLASVDVASGEVARVPLNTANESFPDPAGIAVSADGRRAWVASGGSDRVCELDLERLRALEPELASERGEPLWLTREYLVDCVGVGSNPRGVALAGLNGHSTLAVSERLDDTVALLDPDGELIARVHIERPIPDDEVRRGARVFHDASYSFQGSFSCRSCHPDGHTDGLTYDFDIDGVGRNIVLKRSLRGVAGTAPVKWIGLNPTLERQCGPRFAMVLTRADVFPDQELGDLTSFIRSLPAPRPQPQPGLVGERLTGAAARGEAIFNRSERKDGSPIPPEGRCVTCHPPPHYTDRSRADVGTRGPTDKTGEFDVPHLTGIGSKAPYLHDARALTLEEIWTLPGVGDSHGVVSDLNKAELNDLVEYLKGL